MYNLYSFTLCLYIRTAHKKCALLNKQKIIKIYNDAYLIKLKIAYVYFL